MIRKILNSILYTALSIAALVACVVVYAAVSTHIAKKNSETLCKLVNAGETESSARAKLSSGQGDFSINKDHGYLGVGYKGAFVEKWFCNVYFAKGKVTKVEVRHLD